MSHYPWRRWCRCGDPGIAHRHIRARDSHCALCDCPRYRPLTWWRRLARWWTRPVRCVWCQDTADVTGYSYRYVNDCVHPYCLTRVPPPPPKRARVR